MKALEIWFYYFRPSPDKVLDEIIKSDESCNEVHLRVLLY